MAVAETSMHGGPARDVAFGSNWMDPKGASAHWALPPDVEPPEETDAQAMRRWLDARHMAASDRGAALQGAEIGRHLGELLRYFTHRLPWRRVGPARAASSEPLRFISLPRIRRATFYRRARALQFKKNCMP